jgi:hypothetical protein
VRVAALRQPFRAKNLNECGNISGYFIGTLRVVFQPEKTVRAECNGVSFTCSHLHRKGGKTQIERRTAASVEGYNEPSWRWTDIDFGKIGDDNINYTPVLVVHALQGLASR